jgi:lipoprotein-releasing system permease protein
LTRFALAFIFARRYLVSKKSSNAINLVSWISVAGIFVGSFGLILVLSVFNGFEGLVISLYNSFNPDFTITAREGKSFVPDSVLLQQITALPDVNAVSSVIEENALLTYQDRQYIATVKGVEENYGDVSGIDSAIFTGTFLLQEDQTELAVLGIGIQQSLQVNYDDPFGFISVYIPKRAATTVFNPEDAFNRELIRAAGSFAIQSEFDSKYILVPLGFARRLTGLKKEVSALEIKLTARAEEKRIQQQLQALAGETLVVKNRLEQNETLYKVMQTEKWAVYAILTFILIIAAFNVVGSLSMLVIEKRKDITILKTMGADEAMVRLIFVMEGMLISLVGCAAGFLAALLIILAQQYFHLLKMGGGSFVIDAYPVVMKPADFLLVFATVMLIGWLAARLPSGRAATTSVQLTKD